MFRKKLNWKQSKTWYVIYVHGRARFIKQLLKKPKHALPLPKENRIRNVGIITIIKWVTCCELVQTFRIRNVLLFGWFFFWFYCWRRQIESNFFHIFDWKTIEKAKLQWDNILLLCFVAYRWNNFELLFWM